MDRIDVLCEMDHYFEEVYAGTVAGKRGPFHKLIVGLDCSDLDTPEVRAALDDYVKEGHPIDREEFDTAMYNLMRKWHNPTLALELSEWSEENKHIVMEERDYGDRVYVIGMVKGLDEAEKYLGKIPEQFKSEVVYRSLLECCVREFHFRKAEEVFNKMRSLGFQITAFVCNLLLLSYKRIGPNKVANILLMMEKENVVPTDFTYRILTKPEGSGQPVDRDFRASVARYFIQGNLNEKAESILKEIEGNDIAENRSACVLLLPLYAELGKVDEVERIWKVCEANPHPHESMAAMEAWHKLGREDKKLETLELYNGWFERTNGENL